MKPAIVWLQIGAFFALALVLLVLVFAGIIPVRYIDAIVFSVPVGLVAIVVINGIVLKKRSKDRMVELSADDIEAGDRIAKSISRKLRIWLLIAPVLYVYAMWESRHQSTVVRISLAIFGLCLIGYVYRLTRRC